MKKQKAQRIREEVKRQLPRGHSRWKSYYRKAKKVFKEKLKQIGRAKMYHSSHITGMRNASNYGRGH